MKRCAVELCRKGWNDGGTVVLTKADGASVARCVGEEEAKKDGGLERFIYRKSVRRDASPLLVCCLVASLACRIHCVHGQRKNICLMGASVFDAFCPTTTAGGSNA